MDLFEDMIVTLPAIEVPGTYDPEAQTWSVECEAQRSPQKHHQEN
ncbi:hypothetical protein [Blastococcus sp. CT_GayMR16]|nr:hypothetical protein [Blastococcus sp. CT_GayMR16]